MNLPWSEEWFNEARLSLYPKLFVAFYVVVLAGWALVSENMLDPSGKPIGADFITYWAASDLALHGHPADAYDVAKIVAAEKKAVPASQETFLWHYPPVFHLIVLPLALLPYLWSYVAWTGSMVALYAAALRRMLPGPHSLWLLLGFPAVLVNVLHGQNGLLTAVMVAGACLSLERRPILAGVLIGALCYKPHFGLLFPLILIAGRHWAAFAAAAACTAVLAVAAALALGTETWVAFWSNLATARAVLEHGHLPWSKMPSLFAGARMLGAPIPVAYGLHLVLAVAVIVSTVRVWRRRQAPLTLRTALLCVALVLVPPYSFDYDLALLAVPTVLLIDDGQRSGWVPGLRSVIVAAWLTPLALPGLADLLPIPLMPLVLVAYFALILRRIAAGAAGEGDVGAGSVPQPSLASQELARG